MPGSSPRGHHFIPQFLLRGFSSRSRKKEFFSFLYRRGITAVETNIKNIAKARDFHGKPDEMPVERSLSEIENDQALLVQKLRVGEGLDRSKEIASLVASIQVRSENVRKVMAESSQKFLEMMAEKLCSREARIALATAVIEELKGRLEAGYYDSQINQLPPQDRALAPQRFLASANDGLRSEVDNFASGFALALKAVDFGNSAITAHLNALRDELTPRARVELLSALSWQIIRLDYPLILGDVCTVADFGSDTPLSNLLGVADRLDAIYLPLCIDTVLVGSSSHEYEPRTLEELNRASAALSADFFVSGLRTSGIDSLADSIGSRRSLMANEEMGAILPQFSQESLRQALFENRHKEGKLGSD